MGEVEFSPEVCRLRHDAQDLKIKAINDKVDAVAERVNGLKNGIDDVRRLQTQIKTIDDKVDAVTERVNGLKDGIDDVRRLQTQILYAIIGLCGMSILILIGVIAGRTIDFGVIFR